MRRSVAVDLVAEAADEHVDGPVAMGRPAAPDLLQQLVPRHHPTLLQRQRIQQPKLRRRQLARSPHPQRLHIPRINQQLLNLDRLTPMLLLRPHPPPSRSPHPSHQLLHRKRLHQIIIRTNLQRMHPIMLRPPRRHHHNRRPDPLLTRRLDQLPTIQPRQHQIQHTHIRTLEPKPRQPSLTLRQPTTDQTPPPPNAAPSPAQSPHRPRRSTPSPYCATV